MATILIAEDEPSINNLIAANLRLVGHRCTQVFTGPDALQAAAAGGYDLLLLDIMLPDLDGYEIKARLPADQPVIFVTARAGLEDKLRGLGLGADDYIVKPFEILELLARINNVLRRTKSDAALFTLGALSVDLAAHRVFRAGQPVELTPQEYSLLETLIINRNLALSREKLLAAAWGYDYEGETRTADVHIQRLRKKLGLEKEIQTVFKVGYRLNTK